LVIGSWCFAPGVLAVSATFITSTLYPREIHLTLETQRVNLRYWQYQPLQIMTNINQKHKILESLDLLDQAQTEKVLDYIKGMTQPLGNEQRIKHEALKQIRQALGNARTLNPSF
jgi:hypothetical protein